MHGTHLALSRRHFILTAATAAGGFMIGIGAAPHAADAATVPGQPWDTESGYSPNDIDAWIAIDPDDFDSDPLSAIGDGAGQHDGAADDNRRRAAV